MKMLSRITLCAMAFAGVAYTADAQQIALAHSYSDGSAVATGSPTTHITIYAARIQGSPENEISSYQLRVYFNLGATAITEFIRPPGQTTSIFTANPNQALDSTDLDQNPATTNFGSISAVLTAGFPLRNNANTVPASWAPGQPTNGAFEPVVVVQFTNPPAASEFGYTAFNAPSQSGIFTRPWGQEASGTQLTLAQVTGMAGRQEGVLAVEMIDLSAKQTPTGVLVSWETGMEIDNAGFNVYSHPALSSGLTKLNPILIGAAGTAASYSFADPNPLAAGEARAYFVEDVDVTGLATTLHGPAIVQGATSANVPDWNLF